MQQEEEPQEAKASGDASSAPDRLAAGTSVCATMTDCDRVSSEMSPEAVEAGEADRRWMAMALREARRAAQLGEVPVGAVVVQDDRLVAQAHNLREATNDPTAHAEVVALRAAAERLGTWRLLGCTLYVTLEPCAMCAGALVNARIERLVFGATDPKAGFCGTLGDIVRDPRLNHRLSLTAGVGSAESSRLLVEFFRRRRKPCQSEGSD